jgi:hypothetical protein
MSPFLVMQVAGLTARAEESRFLASLNLMAVGRHPLSASIPQETQIVITEEL